tara:strand:+ start:379 stop:648 length:270 start_codon:yes stop_codon:yes gene_type:complete
MALPFGPIAKKPEVFIVAKPQYKFKNKIVIIGINLNFEFFSKNKNNIGIKVESKNIDPLRRKIKQTTKDKYKLLYLKLEINTKNIITIK